MHFMQELNAIFFKPLREVLSSQGEVDEAAIYQKIAKG
jgi:hypothetical protein